MFDPFGVAEPQDQFSNIEFDQKTPKGPASGSDNLEGFDRISLKSVTNLDNLGNSPEGKQENEVFVELGSDGKKGEEVDFDFEKQEDMVINLEGSLADMKDSPPTSLGSSGKKESKLGNLRKYCKYLDIKTYSFIFDVSTK